MSSKVEILNPLEYPNWDDLLLTNENYSFFHTSAWARVLSESYRYTPLYFTAIDNSKLSALIPVMEINSFLTGRRGVSLPFTDYCAPIVPDEAQFNEMITRIIEYGKKARWKYIEWRGGETYFQGIEPSLSYYGHALALTPGEHEIFAGFRDSTKRNIKKAIKEGVDAKISNYSEALKAFYQLHCNTRKYHGLPPQPYSFFDKIYEHIISKEEGFVVLASYQKRTIAAAVFFHFGEKAIYKYGASDKAYQHLRANNLVMWEAIRWSAQNGLQSFNFGRTEPENDGLLQFKRGWATSEKMINYYKYDFEKESFINERSKVTGFHNRVFSITPIPLLRFVGSMLYKHIA